MLSSPDAFILCCIYSDQYSGHTHIFARKNLQRPAGITLSFFSSVATYGSSLCIVYFYVLTAPSLSLPYWEYKIPEAGCFFHVSVQWVSSCDPKTYCNVFSRIPRLVGDGVSGNKWQKWSILPLFLCSRKLEDLSLLQALVTRTPELSQGRSLWGQVFSARSTKKN